MIRRPVLGQLVQLHYAAARRGLAVHHGAVGRVVAVARGRGPLNHGVLLSDGTLTIVPSGNLREVVPAPVPAPASPAERMLF